MKINAIVKVLLFVCLFRHDNLMHKAVYVHAYCWGSQLKSSGEQLKSRDLFLDMGKLQLHLAVSG